jgi:hypothetical protein
MDGQRMSWMSARPLEQIRSADRAIEEMARQAVGGEPNGDDHDGDVLYHFDLSVASGLAASAAAPYEHEVNVPGTAQRWNPTMVLAEADHNAPPGADVLEALLYLADPESKCRQIAEKALEVFGSVGAVLSARVPDLTMKLGVRQGIAYALRAIHAGMRSVLREPLRERIQIGSFSELIDYVGITLKHETVEVLRMLYLDRKNGADL